MYEEIAWKNFLKTGNVESFLEYKKLSELNMHESFIPDDEDEDNLEEGC